MKKRQPDVNDLRWEIIRRNPDYRSDYEEFKNALKAGSPKGPFKAAGRGFRFSGELEGFFCQKWDLNRMHDPADSWEVAVIDWPTGEKILNSPADKPRREEAAVTEILGFSNHETEIEKAGGKDFMYFRVNPNASLDAITEQIRAAVSHHKKNAGIKKTKEKITERLFWIDLADRYGEKPAREQFKADRTLERQWASGRILIENPFDAPLRHVSQKEAEEYVKTHTS